MALVDGRKTVTTAGTAVPLGSSTAITEVIITALSGNTTSVSIGGSTVVAASGATRKGTPLNAGDTLILTATDLGNVFVDSITNGEGVSFSYTTPR